MVRKLAERPSVALSGLLLLVAISSFSGSGNAGNPGLAVYDSDYSRLFWFIQASDTHIGASGAKDNTNLNWLVTTAKVSIAPSFIIVTGDLTDSTNGNWLGLPNGPYQAEWDEYNSILTSAGITTQNAGDFYYDLPGNHDAYNDGGFSYYLSNSIQGRITGMTQASFVKEFAFGKYHFLGLNTAGSGLPFSLIRPWGDDAGLSPAELTFIQQEMASKSPGAQLTLVFGHHPLFDTGDSDDTWVGPGLTEFLGLMNTYMGALYGYGHTHASSEWFFVPNPAPYPGFYYFNVASLGKDTPNQYGITAIDNNGISSKAFTVGAWPAVLITSPLDAQFGAANPYAYSVPASNMNFVRALVFDNPSATPAVSYRIDGGATWSSMSPTSTAHVYQGAWDASALSAGTHTIEVQATSPSGTRSDVISVNVAGSLPVPIGAAIAQTGKYSKRNFIATSAFKPGDKVVFRLELRDTDNLLLNVSNATIQLTIKDSQNVDVATLTSGPTNAGKAEATWATAASNKRGTNGTPTGNYAAVVTGISAPPGYLMDPTLNVGAVFTLTR